MSHSHKIWHIWQKANVPIELQIDGVKIPRWRGLRVRVLLTGQKCLLRNTQTGRLGERDKYTGLGLKSIDSLKQRFALLEKCLPYTHITPPPRIKWVEFIPPEASNNDEY
jgi:hypothetical protein